MISHKSDLAIVPREFTVARALWEIDVDVRRSFSALLQAARPTRDKRHRLIRTLELYGADQPRSVLESVVHDYYSSPFFERRSPLRDLCDIKDRSFQDPFLLTFGTAEITETDRFRVSQHLRYKITENLEMPTELTEAGLLQAVAFRMTHPRHDLVSSSLQVEDVLHAWERVSFKKWGSRYDDIFNYLLMHLNLMRSTLFEDYLREHVSKSKGRFVNQALSQTDIDWMNAVLDAIDRGGGLPDYPLSRGPQNPETRLLEKVVRTLNVNVNRLTLEQSEVEQLIHTAREVCERSRVSK